MTPTMDLPRLCGYLLALAVCSAQETVRLNDGLAVAAEMYHLGRVEMFDDGRWYAVCGETFDKTAATVVCRELGFPIAVLLTPDSFSNSRANSSVSSLVCSGNETSLSQCSYSLGRCDKYSQQAALLCQQPDAQHNTTMTISGTYTGDIIVTMFGIEGSVCMEGWDDEEASLACISAGFTSGVVLAGSKPFVRHKPLWAFKFECIGHETRLEECAYQWEFDISDWTCAEDLLSAGVLCFNNTPPEPLVRIIQDGDSKSEGRVEVFSEQTEWGTICNSGWSLTDAKVVCRQLGYADGQTHTSGFRQADSTVAVVLSDLQCDGTERTIFECPNGGWDKVSTSCSSHNRDAGVYCYRHITLDPTNVYGAVLYHDGERYGLVCGENFDHDDASVVCRELGHSYAKLMSGSAFGPKNLAISMSNVECSGSEDSIQDCRSTTENPVCPSGHYASVVCSKYAEEAIGFTKIWADNALVEIRYFLHPGYVCTEDFTDEDAALVCRLHGLTYGYAYRASAAGLENNIRWLNGLSCIMGAETSFDQCGPHDWGQIGACNWEAVAAVMCSDNEGDMIFETRLVNGTSTVGRLEINIKSTWGTVCGTDLTKNEAAVICRGLGYQDGITMAPGQYGDGTGPVLLSGLKCQGDENSIKDCIWSGYDQSSLVCDHTKDAAIRCFSNIPAPKKEDTHKPVYIIIAVVLCVVLIILGTIVLLCLLRGRQTRNMMRSNEAFDNTENCNGIVDASNRPNSVGDNMYTRYARIRDSQMQSRIVKSTEYSAYTVGGEDVVDKDEDKGTAMYLTPIHTEGVHEPQSNIYQEPTRTEKSPDKVRGEITVDKDADKDAAMYITPIHTEGVHESQSNIYQEPTRTEKSPNKVIGDNTVDKDADNDAAMYITPIHTEGMHESQSNIYQEPTRTKKSPDKVRGEDSIDKGKDVGLNMYLSPISVHDVKSSTSYHPDPRWTEIDG